MYLNGKQVSEPRGRWQCQCQWQFRHCEHHPRTSPTWMVNLVDTGDHAVTGRAIAEAVGKIRENTVRKKKQSGKEKCLLILANTIPFQNFAMCSISQSLKSFCPWASCPARAEISKKSVPWANIQNVAGCKTTSQNHTVNREISSKALTASICQQCLNTKSTQTYKIILFDLWTSAWSIIFRILSRTKNFPLLRCSFTASDVLMRKFRSGRSSFWKSSIGYEVICVKESEIITEAPFSFPIFSPIQVLLVTFFAIHVKLHLQRMCQGARSEPPWVTSSSLLRIDVNSDYHLLMCLQTLKYLYFQHDGNVLKFRIQQSFTWDEQHLCAPLKVCNHCHVDLTPFLKDRVIVFGFAPARFRECSFSNISAVYQRHDAVLRTGVS